MKRSLVALGLTAVVLIATASDAFAQRIRIGGPGGISIGGGSGWGSPGGNYYGPGGYYGSGYYGRGYGSGYYGSNYWGPGYYGSGYYGSPYYGNRYYNTWPSYSSGYYYSEPDYYYSSPGYAQFPPTSSSTSMYYDPTSAMITVMVPSPDAKVWFDESPTQQRGMERSFHTPGLKQAGTYTIKAQWTENGRNIDQQRDVRVQPGQSVTVDFRQPVGENLPRPQPPQPQK